MSKNPAADETFQLVVTPALRPIIDSITTATGMVLVPMPVIGPDGQPTLDPEHWPGDDLPTYALHPA